MRDIRAALVARRHLPDVGSSAPEEFDLAVDAEVRAFQQERGLVVDGVVGTETWSALVAAGRTLGDRLLRWTPTPPYTTGDDVAELQDRLMKMGFDVGRVDGLFGRRTEEALRSFQRERQLRADGICGPLTFAELKRLVHTVRGGNPHELREHERLRRSGQSLAGRVVVVDAGHGGGDRGVVAHGTDEREVVADIARRLVGRLEAAGVTAVQTHPAWNSPPAGERARVANQTEADLVISLHTDGTTSASPHGAATYYYGTGRDGASVVGARLADLVQREVVARTSLLDGRTHPKTWELLRLTRMPAVRLEVGYLSNPSDARSLGTAAFRDTVAEAVLVAVQRLFLPVELDPPTGTLRLPAGGMHAEALV